MLYKFNNFKSQAFLQRPDVIEIDGYRIEYMGFCKEEHLNKVPVIFIGGAFQNFFSFKKEVQVLMNDYPVVLLDLPSQGSNQQLVSELEFKDFAKLLKSFCDYFSLAKISPIALSYGSATAFYFASLYPQSVDRLILGGTSPHIRESIAKLLRESIRVLKSGDKNLFAEGAVLNLINFAQRNKTNISPRIIKGFFNNMKSLCGNSIQRYIDNTTRLLNLENLHGTPSCPTLVCTGEYDSFTTPYENYLIAKKIPLSTMVLIEGADHLANLEKRDAVLRMYQSFLNDEDMGAVEGIRLVDQSQFSHTHEKRLNKRKSLHDTYVTLVDENSIEANAKVEDINYFGCKLSFEGAPPEQMNLNSTLEFHFCDSQHNRLQELGLSGFLFDDLKNPRCIFKRGSFQQGTKLEQFLETLS